MRAIVPDRPLPNLCQISLRLSLVRSFSLASTIAKLMSLLPGRRCDSNVPAHFLLVANRDPSTPGMASADRPESSPSFTEALSLPGEFEKQFDFSKFTPCRYDDEDDHDGGGHSDGKRRHTTRSTRRYAAGSTLATPGVAAPHPHPTCKVACTTSVVATRRDVPSG